MPKKLINTGTSNDSGNGDSLRSAFTKINENFNELYTLTGSSNTASEVDIKGSVFADDSTLIVDGVNGILNGNLNGNVTGDVTGNVTGDLTGNVTSTTSSSTFANLAITSTLDLTGASVSSDVNFGTNDLTGINNITIGGNLLTSAMSPLLATGSNGQNLTLAGGQSTSGDGGDAILNAGSGTGTNGDVQIGASNTATITIGDGSNTVDYPSGTTVDFTGATITGTSFLTSVPAQTFASLTSKPTTIAGYGITDAVSTASPAFTGAVDFTGTTSVDFTGSTVSGLTVTETDPVVGAITGIVKADGSGNISAAVAGTDYSTFDGAFSSLSGTPTTLAGYGITDAASLNNMAPTGAVDFTGATTIDFNTVTINNLEFADISAKPTTIAGYGITDAFDGAFASLTGKPTTLAGYGITDGLQLGTSSTTALAGDTALFSGAFADLTGKPTTVAGYGITDALTSGGALVGSSLDTNTIQTSSGNLAISADNYVQINSDNDGQIEIGTASGLGNVRIGNESNGTQVSIEGEAFIQERARFDKGVEEKFATINGATGVTALDCANGHVHYLTAPAGDITANFTNLGLTAEYATNLTVIIDQGNTQYEVTAVQIGGAAQTIVWQGNSAPTGTANGVDSFSFTILNDGGTYVVLGQMVAFGGV